MSSILPKDFFPCCLLEGVDHSPAIYWNNYVDRHGRSTGDPTDWQMLSFTLPTGVIRQCKHPGFVTRLRQDGFGFARNLVTNEVASKLLPDYYSCWEPSDPDEDTCMYCGAYNGKQSELRQGHNCYYCGSN